MNVPPTSEFKSKSTVDTVNFFSNGQCLGFKKIKLKLGMVAYTFTLSTQEADGGQPEARVQSETLSQKKRRKLHVEKETQRQVSRMKYFLVSFTEAHASVKLCI